MSIGVLSGCWALEQLPDLFDGSGGDQPPAGQELPADRLPAAASVTTRVINEAQVPADVRVVYLIEQGMVHHATSLLGAAPDATSSADVGPDEADTVVVDGAFLFDDADGARVAQAAQPFGPLVFVSGADFQNGDVLEVRLRPDGVEVNRPPTAFDVEVSAEPGSPIQVTLQASDPDGDPLTFAIVDEPLLGSLTNQQDGDDTVTYWPPGEYYGPDSFTFVASDGLADSNVATVFIDVLPTNQPPFINLLHPDGPLFVQVDRIVVVRWVDDDDLGSAQINVWYSDSSELGGGTQEGLINPSPIDQATGPDRVDFDTSGLSMGVLWYIHAVIDDGVNAPVISTGGPITLTIEPYGQMQVSEGRWYEGEQRRVLGDQDGGAIGSLAAGDVNDDAADDLVIGASQYGDHGRVFVLYGGDWVYDPNDPCVPIWTHQIVPPLGNYVQIYQDPNSPDPNAGRIGQDVACGYLLGYVDPPSAPAVSTSTQGGADVLIGSPQASVIDYQGAGEAVLQFGEPIAFGLSPVDYADLYNNSVGYALAVTHPARDIGWSVAIGDITYDGDRPLIGAPGYGCGYVFAVMEPLVEPPFFSPLDTGAAVFYLDPNGPSDFAQLGWALAGGGDLDTNEGPDVAMGAPTADLGGGPNAGSVWVVAAEWEYYDVGGQFTLPQEPNMPVPPSAKIWRVDGAEAGDQFGSSLVFADFDGNWFADDLIVGAPNWLDGTGKVYAIVGRDSYPGDPNAPGLADQTTAVNAGDIASMGMGWEFRGAPGDQAGTAVAVNDFDLDDDTDIVIGAPGADGGAGAIYVVYAQTLASLPRVVDLADIGGSLPGLKISGQPGERLGSDLTGLDWYSRGGQRDLAAAAPGADTDGAGGGSNQGAVYLFRLRPAE